MANITVTTEIDTLLKSTVVATGTTSSNKNAVAALGAVVTGGAVTGLNMSTARILGRTTASTGAVEEITVGSGLSLASGTLTATGTGALPSANIFVGSGSDVATAVPMSGDIAITNTGVTSIADGAIVNADISPTAAINVSKLSSSAASAGLVLTSTGGSTAPTFQAVSGSGTGDVVGPASATDNAIARFDTGTGKLLKNSLVSVSATGAITAPAVGSIIPFYWQGPSTSNNTDLFPAAGPTNHGAVIHSHEDAAMYFSHGGVWTKMLDEAVPENSRKAIFKNSPSRWAVIIGTQGTNGSATSAASAGNAILYSAKASITNPSELQVAHVISGTSTTATVTQVSNVTTITCGSNCDPATVILAVNALSASKVNAYSLGSINNRNSSNTFKVAASANTFLTHDLDIFSSRGETPTGSLGPFNKIIQADGSGNIITAPLDNRVYDSATGAGSVGDQSGFLNQGFGGAGNIVFPDQQGLRWVSPDDKDNVFTIRHWYNHDQQGGESIIESAWRMAFISKGPIQFGQNDANKNAQCLHMTAGGTTTTNNLKHSVAITQQTKRKSAAGTDTVGYAVLHTTSDSVDSGTVFKVNILESDTSNTGPVMGFLGSPDATTGGRAYGTPILEVRADGTKTTNLKLTGAIQFSDNTTLSSVNEITSMAAYATSRSGFVNLTGTTPVTVAMASISAYDIILLTRQDPVGTLGHLSYAKSFNSGFSIVSTSAETSKVGYLVISSAASDVTPPVVTVASDTALAANTNANIGDTLTVAGNGPFQWYLDPYGSAAKALVSGQTGSTFTVTSEHIGAVISCQRNGVFSNDIVVWHPSSEAGYTADYRNDVGLPTQADGEQVGQWQDQSGNNYHLTQNSALSRPIIGTRNGYKHLLFDGSVEGNAYADWLYAPISNLTIPQTAFVVADYIIATQNARLLTTAGSGNRLRIADDGGNKWVNGASAIATSGTNASNVKITLTGRSTSTANFLRVNAVEFAGSGPLSTASNVGGDGIYIGGIQAQSNGQNCRVYAALFYKADLSPDAQSRVRKYLNTKYAVV